MKKIILQSFVFALLAILFSLPAYAQWYPLGDNVLGQNIVGYQDDLTGYSVSMSGNGMRVAVGSPGNLDTNAGHVRVYTFSGSSWEQIGQDIDGEAATDLFGHSVTMSVDGSRVAIGAPLNDANGNSSGHVRVYTFNGSSWVQLGQDIDGEATGDESGRAVSISADGSRVAIGARANNGNGSLSGHVRVYDWNGSSWVQLGQDIDGEVTNDYFGHSVSISADGNRLAIGAPFNNEQQGPFAAQGGHVRVYAWNGSSWVQLGQDIEGQTISNDQLGWSVSMSSDGNRLAIGSPTSAVASTCSGFGMNGGKVRIYNWNGSSWIQLGQDIDGFGSTIGGFNGQKSGWSVSMSGDGNRVAIGSPTPGGGTVHKGTVRVYDWSGSSWDQIGSQIMTSGYDNGQFGTSVSMSNDGYRLAIGSPYGYLGGNSIFFPGSVHIKIFDGFPPVTRIEQVELPSRFVMLYPNPAQHYFRLQSNTKESLHYCLINVQGQEVLSGYHKGYESEIGLDGIPTGIYTILFDQGYRSQQVYIKGVE